MRYGFILFLVAWIFWPGGISYIYAQPLAKRENILSLNLNNQKLRAISGSYAIAEDQSGKGIYLYSLQGTGSAEAIPLPGNFVYKSAWFDTDGQHIILTGMENQQWVVQVHNIQHKTDKIIRYSGGNVVSASVSSVTGNVLYQVRDLSEYPQIFSLSSEHASPVWVADGIGERWSPNGKWFFLDIYQQSGLKKLIDKYYRSGQISKEEYLRQLPSFQPQYCIYNSQLKLMLALKQYSGIRWIQWSPTSNKIVLKSRESRRGFDVVSLNTKNSLLKISNEYHFFAKEDQESRLVPQSTLNAIISYLYPIFSPDGSKIAYLKVLEDGHNILGKSVWILELDSKKYYPVTVHENTDYKAPVWKDSKNLLLRNSFSVEILRLSQ